MADVLSLHHTLHDLGTWRGQGRGSYPTIEGFSYGEEARFWHSGKPVSVYAQCTWSLSECAPLHSDMGFLGRADDGATEVHEPVMAVVGHPPAHHLSARLLRS